MKLINKIYGRIWIKLKYKRQSHRRNFSSKQLSSVAFGGGLLLFSEIRKKIGQPHPSTPASVMLFSHFEIFEKAQRRGRIREKACRQILVPIE